MVVLLPGGLRTQDLRTGELENWRTGGFLHSCNKSEQSTPREALSVTARVDTPAECVDISRTLKQLGQRKVELGGGS